MVLRWSIGVLSFTLKRCRVWILFFHLMTAKADQVGNAQADEQVGSPARAPHQMSLKHLPPTKRARSHWCGTSEVPKELAPRARMTPSNTTHEALKRGPANNLGNVMGFAEAILLL